MANQRHININPPVLGLFCLPIEPFADIFLVLVFLRGLTGKADDRMLSVEAPAKLKSFSGEYFSTFVLYRYLLKLGSSEKQELASQAAEMRTSSMLTSDS